MRIVSQSKAADINYERYDIEVYENTIEAHGNRKDNWHQLGTYPTKERALEVMAEIRRLYKDYMADKFNYCDKSTNLPVDVYYEMPKE